MFLYIVIVCFNYVAGGYCGVFGFGVAVYGCCLVIWLVVFLWVWVGAGFVWVVQLSGFNMLPGVSLIVACVL